VDNPEKLATLSTQDENKQNKKTQHNMWWTLLYASKHKQRKEDGSLPTKYGEPNTVLFRKS